MNTAAPSTQAQDAIKAAMTVAKDVAEGRLDPDALAAQAAEECRALFGTVAGPGDALWELHVEVARQVLALDGIPVNELAEWLAVTRLAQGVAAQSEPSWIDRVLTGLADEDQDCPHLALDPTAGGELLECAECGELLPDPSDDEDTAV